VKFRLRSVLGLVYKSFLGAGSRRRTGEAAPLRLLLRYGLRLIAISIAVFLAFRLISFLVSAYRFHGEFVFVTVEESSSQALAALPLGFERLSDTFVDCEERILELPKKPFLWGVSLGTYYSASSQGIEFEEWVKFSRTGKLTVPVGRPVDVKGRDLSGEAVPLVDNPARIVRGELVVERTERSGAIRFRYGDKRVTLRPGESWAEILALVDGVLVEIGADTWESALEEYLASGVPVTRVAVSNRGFWPKTGVYARGEGVKGIEVLP